MGASHNIVYLNTGKATSVFGNKAFLFSMSLFILIKTSSSIQFNISLAITYLPQILMFPFAGIISDSLNKKWTIVICGFMNAFFASIPLILKFSINSIYLTIFLMSLISSILTISIDSSVPLLIKEKTPSILKRIAAGMQLVVSISSVLAPMFAGIIVDYFSIETMMLIVILSFSSSAISACFLVFNQLQNKKIKKRGHNCGSVYDSIQYIFVNKWAFRLVFTECVMNFTLAFGILSVFQIVVTNIWNLSSKYLGVFNSMEAIGILVTSCLIYNKSHLKMQTDIYPRHCLIALLCTILLSAICIIASATIPIIICFIILSFLQFLKGCCCAKINISIVTAKQLYIPEKILGRVLGIMNACSFIMIPFGLLLSGILVYRIEIYMLPLMSGVIMFLFLLISDTIFKNVSGLQ